MRLLLVFFCLLTISDVAAQEVTRKFYDREGFETDSVDSYYYEVSSKNDSHGLRWVSYFTLSGKIKIKTSQPGHDERYDCTYFYPNGSVRGEGSCFEGFPIDLMESFYKSGRPQGEFFFEQKLEPDGRSRRLVGGIINYQDSTGRKMVENGEGHCIRCDLTPYSDEELWESGDIRNGLRVGDWEGGSTYFGYSFRESYQEGTLIKGTQDFNGKYFSYEKVSTRAMPEGGYDLFMGHLSKAIRYPKGARRNSVQGNVYVEFTVDTDGTLTDIEVVRGIDRECDAEARLAVSSSPLWIPATLRGRPVRQRVVVPVKFTLN